MTPLSEHQLLVFWVQLAVLVITARGLGGLMRRFGQPAVVGELAAGLLLGPSLLGRLAPDVYGWLFPADPVQSGLLMAVAWVGVALLLVATGFETDLKLLAKLGRSSVFVSAGSLLVPLLAGFGLGYVLPQALVGPDGERLTFALFMAVALAISALPVVAKILLELGLMRRNIGQITVAAGVSNDLVGWVLLGVIAGVVTSGTFDLAALATTVVALTIFLAVMFTAGQRLTDVALRRARQHGNRMLRSFSVVIVATLVAAAVTQAIGVEAVLGAFIAGILIGRSRYQLPEVRHALETVTNGFFAPVFFATAGLFVDLGLLLEGNTWLWAIAVIAVASLTKLVGSYVGAALGRLSPIEGLAVGVGLNARGALEIVVATIGLGLGVLNQSSYTIVVVMAMATSMMAPPLLRRILRGFEANPDEAARLEREAVLASSVIARTETALLPTRGGENSVLAARLLNLSLQPSSSIAIFTVHREDGANDGTLEATVDELREVFAGRNVERIDRRAKNPSTAICQEATLGYGLVALGLTERFASGESMSTVLHRTLAGCTVPMLLVKHGEGVDAHEAEMPIRRILVPIAGTRIARGAQEIAYTLAGRTGAEVELLHVVNRPDREAAPSSGSLATASRVLREAEELATRFGCRVTPLTRTGASLGQEVTAAAAEQRADLIVMGAEARASVDGVFLGHGVEYVLEHASQTVLTVVFPTSVVSDE
jgi:Kef-type K+ transport system membrane component KefB/nucleotide-binding universal stress UspA family protein